MIPLKLQIKNFLSYGPHTQIIDLSSYQLICLSGKNGHGKSALLDAITWALWGQARKISNTAKADNGLMHLGQTSMIVTLDFECNGQRYRIKREFAMLYGKPYATLEFGMLKENTVVPLTEKKIRATQQVIERTLHLDFDSFINSAFLRQGQSNEFSKKSPKDRKEILSSILGLAQYESIRKLASEKSKKAATEKTMLETLQHKYAQELQEQPQLHAALKELDANLQRLQQEQIQSAGQEQEARKAQKELETAQKKADLLRLQINQSYEQHAALIKRLHELRAQWRSVNTKRNRVTPFAQLQSSKHELLAHLQDVQTLIQNSMALKETILTDKQKRAAIQQQMKMRHDGILNEKKMELASISNQLEQLSKNVHDIAAKYQNQALLQKNYEHERRSLIERIEQLREKVRAQKELEIRFEKSREHYHSYIARANALKAELDEISHKQQLVHDEQAPSCPLCEQNLSASRKRFLKEKFHARQKFITHQLNRFAKLIKKMKELLLAMHTSVEQLKKAQQELTLCDLKKSELEKNLNTHAQEMAAIANEQEILTIAREQLLETRENKQKILDSHAATHDEHLKDPEYLRLHEHILKAEQQTNNFPQLVKEQQEILTAIQAVDHEMNSVATLHEQIALQEQRTQEIVQVCAQLKKSNHELASHLQKLNQFQQLEEQEQLLQQQFKGIHELQHAIKEKKESLLHQKGNLEAQIRKLAQIEKEFHQQQQQIKELESIIDDYTIIIQTIGKDGLQALLIEDAIPEIEHEANQLLAKLTDNQAQIFIESLRDLKKGGTRETLDIKISDSIGMRPYELFSGGEAFRIDFALRIAISKLLAKRAGTTLQTLIIDEGFGSQDEEGLSHIMDAIHKIQEDFAKVIIVSHLPSMKDQFPVHFVVEKGAQGSHIKVVEQG